MAYGTPADPVAGTVITVAYAVANLLDPIRALRAFTGNSDPPGTGYVVTSDSTSATSWKTFLAAIQAALGGTPLLTSGGTITPGGLSIAGNLSVGGTTTAGPINAGAISGSTGTFSSNVNIGGTTTAGPINAGAITGSTGGFSGALSALSAAITNAVTAASLTLTGALNAATGVFTGLLQANQLQSNVATGTPPLVVASATEVANLKAADAGKLGGLAASNFWRAAEGSYTGDGVSGRVISIGFDPKVVLLSWADAGSGNIATALLVSTSTSTTVAHGQVATVVSAGIVDSAARLTSGGFIVSGSGGTNPITNINAVTYRWKAWG